MRAFLLLGAAALGLLCALGEDGKTATKPEVTAAPKPGGFQTWAKSEIDRLDRQNAEAVQPVKATPREPETQPEPASDELEVAPWEEPQPLTLEQFRRLQELLKRNPNATQQDVQDAIEGAEIVVEEPPDQSPPAIEWEGDPPELIDGAWHRRSKMIIPPDRDAGEALPQSGDRTMTPEHLDRSGVIDGRTLSAESAGASYGSKVCPCVNCQCGADCQCPKGTVLTPDVGRGRLPRLRVTVWDKGCTRCEAFKSGAMAELGWTVGGPESQIEIVTVPGNLESSPPAPLFEYVTSSGVESWVGYTNRDDFMSRLRRAMDLPFESKEATNRAVSSTNPTVTGEVGRHSHRCSSCGTVWSHDPNSPGFEHYSAHSCPSCGRYENEVYQGQPAMQTRGTYYTPAVRQRGFFGRVFNRSGCANGACGR